MRFKRVDRLYRTVLIIGLIALFSSANTTLGNTNILETEIVPEGRDFASIVLNDPWDMAQYSDVSQSINSDGQFNYITNINLSNGIFSATAVDGLRGEGFYVLFPRHFETLPAGKVGERFPINGSVYRCVYLAMRVESQAPNAFGPDQFKVHWFEDVSLAMGRYGTYAAALYNSGFNTPIHYWNLYKVDLSSQWVGKVWQGLRIDPTNQSNIPFAIDWVRLTDCNPTTTTVSWTVPGNRFSIWAKRQGTNHQVRIASDLTGSRTTLDLQGLEPGTYDLSVSSSQESCCDAFLKTVTVNRAPVAEIGKPSFITGNSYGDFAGVEWDMDGPTDVDRVDCATSSFADGKLILNTPPYENQPEYCRGGPVSDPKIFLHSPAAINTNEYRYLTFRMYGENEPGKNWQEYGKGMMIRWIWGSGSCYLVSNAVAYDVGWNTYTIDLWDAVGGGTVGKAGTCPPNVTSWLSSGTASEFRFDPNENVSGHNFYQEIDWIRLTKMDQIRTGQVFPVGIKLNHTNNQATYKLYYTSQKAQPQQNELIIYRQASIPPGQGMNQVVYLPLVAHKASNSDLTQVLWDTKGVPPGDYYICAEAWDTINNLPDRSTIRCSEAPVRVLP